MAQPGRPNSLPRPNRAYNPPHSPGASSPLARPPRRADHAATSPTPRPVLPRIARLLNPPFCVDPAGGNRRPAPPPPRRRRTSPTWPPPLPPHRYLVGCIEPRQSTPATGVSEPPPLLICASLAHAPLPPRPVTSLRSRFVVHRAGARSPAPRPRADPSAATRTAGRAHGCLAPQPLRRSHTTTIVPLHPACAHLRLRDPRRPDACSPLRHGRPRPPSPAPDLGNRRACPTPRTGRGLA
nr:atherin-like [Aegilops tauschii subsp. strangulata]